MNADGKVVVGGTNPATVDPAAVGGKAYRLLQLEWLARSGHFRVPQCCVFPSVLWSNYVKDRGAFPRIPFRPLPQAHEIAQEVVEYFGGYLERNLDQLLVWSRRYTTENPPLVRSSITLDVEETVLTFAGVNYTFDPNWAPDETNYLSYGVPRVLAAMYRPYAEWYLHEHGLASMPRPVGLILSEYVDKAVTGTVYVSGNDAVVNLFRVESPFEFRQVCLDGNCFARSSMLTFSVSSLPEKWPEFWQQRDWGSRLWRAVNSLCRVLGQSAQIEVEFAFDRQDVLYLTQFRPLPIVLRRAGFASAPSGTGIGTSAGTTPILQSVGKASGKLFDLTSRERSMEALQTIPELLAGNLSNLLVLVNEVGSHQMDAFALMWALAKRGERIRGLQILLGHGAWRYRTHLPSVLLESPSIGFLGQVCMRNLRGISDGSVFTVEADGLTCAVERG